MWMGNVGTLGELGRPHLSEPHGHVSQVRELKSGLPSGVRPRLPSHSSQKHRPSWEGLFLGRKRQPEP